MAKKAKNARHRANRRIGRAARRDLEDAYVTARNDEHVAQSLGLPSTPGGWLTRAAFKLFELDEKCRFLTPQGKRQTIPKVVVDLGAAPGGWTQMAQSAAEGDGDSRGSIAPPTLFALDKLPLAPELAYQEGVNFIQGDFLDFEVQDHLSSRIHAVTNIPLDQPGVDVVLSDMMANTSGNRITNTAASLSLVMAAHHFCLRNLKVGPHSWLVIKVFQSEEAMRWRKAVLERCFDSVGTHRAKTSRVTSPEVYWVCRGHRGGGHGALEEAGNHESGF
ncbi:FtsJ-domain-containing protein [Jaminaea rosea]|uniref:rRNA methyltransferase 2, mitochondrial n=1 Tax=Jaminaea rosea TaxID=1569628 RepID=A0A316UK46_9BASI|nr:FtsJ-domain-containing protein [Jaminaea rosea]PWN25672.1 FtsJ-domain-containing protein [Jaminaea rosea]